MDDRAFAELTKRLAAPSRRGMIRTLVSGLVGAGLVALERPTELLADAVESQGICRPANFPCGDPLQCCARKCKNRKCGCNPRGAACIKGLGISCCTRRCRKGRCT
jgi:hypothetical protein